MVGAQWKATRGGGAVQALGTAKTSDVGIQNSEFRNDHGSRRWLPQVLSEFCILTSDVLAVANHSIG